MLGALSIQRLKTATTKNKNKGDWGVHSSFHCGISKSNSNPFILHLSSARSTRTRRLRSRSMRRRWWHRLIAPSRNLTTLLPSPLSWRNLELVISTTRLPVHIWRYVQRTNVKLAPHLAALSGLILCLRLTNERRRYFVMTSLIGWPQA